MIIDSDNKVNRPKTHNCEKTWLQEEKNDSERKRLRKFVFLIGNKFPKFENLVYDTSNPNCDKSKRFVTPHWIIQT